MSPIHDHATHRQRDNEKREKKFRWLYNFESCVPQLYPICDRTGGQSVGEFLRNEFDEIRVYQTSEPSGTDRNFIFI